MLNYQGVEIVQYAIISQIIPTFQEEDLDQQYKVLRDDIDQKLDRIEWLQGGLKVLDDELKKENQSPVELIDDAADQKERLQSRLEVLDDELEKQNQSPVELIDEAAAGIRR